MVAENSPSAGHLRGALRGFALGSQFDFQAPHPGALRRIGEQLEQRCAAILSASVAADVVEESHRAIVTVLHVRDPFSQLSVRELRWLPFALFYPIESPSEWLANDKRVVEKYFRWIDSSRNNRALVRLLRVFVLNHEPALATYELLRKGIRARLDSFESPRLAERRAWAEEHRVLEPDAARAFLHDWVQRPSGLANRLERFGRDGELALSRFMRAVERVICGDTATIGPQLTEAQFLAAVNALSLSVVGGSPRFRDLSSGITFANSVLLSFTSGRPPERLRMAIRQALVDRLGDPRLPSHFATWSGVSKQALQVFRRWLVDDTLRVFFEVISEASQNSPEKKAQWEARRQFWSAYLDDITDAWVALSGTTKRLTSDNQAFRDIPHGTMEGANDNSVLIMAIDDLHLVEFSHVGGVRYWPANQASDPEKGGAPELFKETYRMRDFSVSERSNIPHHDGWQSKVRTIIRNETGVRGSR